VPKPRVAEEAGEAATVGDAVAKKPASRSRKTKTEEEVPVDVKPAATIVKPKPAGPATEVAPEPPFVPTPEPEIVPEPTVVAPLPEPIGPKPPVAPIAPPPGPAAPKKPEPKIVPFRPLERGAPAPSPRPSRQPAGPFAPPRVTVSPSRPAAPAPPPRPAPQPAAPIVSRPAVPAAPPAPPVPAPVPVAPAAVAPVVVEEPTAPPVEVRRELIRVPESVTVGELAEKMRRKSGEVIKALLELGVMATVNELLDPTAARLVADIFNVDVDIRSVEADVVMPRSQEATNDARAANVRIIVAVNTIDSPEADPDRVKRELSNLNLVPEEWGGSTIFVPTSAKTGGGIEPLLEMTAVQSEI